MNAQNRLQRIKIDAEDFEYPDEILNRADILWLISEAERLERKADDAVMLIHKLQAENERLLIDNRVLADSAADVINEKQSLRVKVINLGGTP